MFQKLKRLRLPFLPKKPTETPLDELIVAALEEAKDYPLIQDSDELDALFKSKFVTDKGIQLPPRKLMTTIISHIEKNPPQTTEQFSLFVRETLATMSTQVVAEKKKK